VGGSIHLMVVVHLNILSWEFVVEVEYSRSVVILRTILCI